MRISNILTALAAGTMLTVTTIAAQAEGKLNIYNWAGYTPPELVEKFEKETGIDVTIDTYDSNETLLAKLKAGGGGYDIIVTAHTFIEVNAKEGLIQKFNPKDLPNFKYLDKKFVDPSWDPEGQYSLPYQWGTTSFAVDTAVYDKPIDSFETLFNPPAELAGKVGMLKGGSDLIAMAELYLGVPLCSEDPAEMQKVLDLLLAQKQSVKVYAGAAALRDQMVSGEIAMTSNYSGQVQRARADKKTVQYIYPKEGVIAWVDALAIPADAKNLENARKFADFLLAPENAGALSNHAGYSNGSVGSQEFMKPELIEAPELNVPEGIKTEPMKTCSPAANELEAQIMTQLMQ
ncbi:extracellular solute-binding protein [Pseudaminobacter sp. NGMCC 1.201702]|uniref:extracellular solute-binding protein n=1 Tax=Pseudaminobacter sp. NGMCC 1.201702 TaxID=3391825 RepID=UPI0039F0A747